MPELFVMPASWMFKAPGAVIVKPLAPGLKMISARSITPDCEMAVMFETAKVAVSDGSLGTVLGVQFVAVFQSPVVGLRFQVALPALAACTRNKERSAMTVSNRKNILVFISSS